MVDSGRRGRRTSLRKGQTHQTDSAHHSVATITEERGRSPIPVSADLPHSPTPSPGRPRFPSLPHSPTSSPSRSRFPSMSHSESHLRRHSRPGTSESARNQRLEHIRALHSSPPTREASPSRSVWFVDEVPPSASMDLGRSQPPTPPDEDMTGDAMPDSARSKGIP